MQGAAPHMHVRPGLRQAVIWGWFIVMVWAAVLPGRGSAQGPQDIWRDDEAAVAPALTSTSAATVPAPTSTVTRIATVDAPTMTPTLTATEQPPSPTATRQVVYLRLPLVFKNHQGPVPPATRLPTSTVAQTLAQTPTMTVWPTQTVQPTPAITETYGTLTISGPTTDRPAAEHPDLNLSLRSYLPTQAALVLIDLGGGTDPNAPQLWSLGAFGIDPWLVSAYQVYDWDWEHDQRGDSITNPAVTLLGIATQPTALVRTPPAGYDLGEGYCALVLYARADAITLKYTREDHVVYGYTLHIEGIQLDPALLSLYNGLDRSGRDRLPALRGDQPFGWAAGGEIRVAVRDCGSFMDPRSRKDWWQVP